jgi:hypothetical protein
MKATLILRGSRAMPLQVFTLRERPELRSVIFSADFFSIWPEYIRSLSLYFSAPLLEQYLDYILIGVDGGDVVARGFSVPFAFNIPGREQLPEGGWRTSTCTGSPRRSARWKSAFSLRHDAREIRDGCLRP